MNARSLNLSDPLRVDARGRTAEADDDRHLNDLIEEVLFTRTRERVNRPDFGADLMALNFENLGDIMTATLQMRARSELERWLGDLIDVTEIAIQTQEGTLFVEISYVVRRTGQTAGNVYVRQGVS